MLLICVGQVLASFSLAYCNVRSKFLLALFVVMCGFGLFYRSDPFVGIWLGYKLLYDSLCH